MPRALWMLAVSCLALNGAACGRLHYAQPPDTNIDAAVDAPRFDASIDAAALDLDAPAIDADLDAHSDAFAVDTNPPRTDFLGPLPECPDVIASFPASNAPFKLVGASGSSLFLMFRSDAVRTYAGIDVPATGGLMELSLEGAGLRLIDNSAIGFVRQVEAQGAETTVVGDRGFATLGAGPLAVEFPVRTDAEVPAFDARGGARLFWGAVNRTATLGTTMIPDTSTGIDPLVAAFIAGSSGTTYARRMSFAGTQVLSGAALLADGRAVVSFSVLTPGFAVDGRSVARGDVVVLEPDGTAAYVTRVSSTSPDVLGEVRAHPLANTFYTEHIDGIDAHVAGAASATPLWSSRWTARTLAQLIGFHVDVDREIAVVAFNTSITWGAFTATAAGAGVAVFRLDNRGIPQAMRAIEFEGSATRLDLILFGQAAFLREGSHVVFGFDFPSPGAVTVCGAPVGGTRNYGWMVIPVP